MKKRLLAISAIAAIASSSTASATTVQWTVESGGNGHWYQVVLGNQTWDQANSAAQASSHNGQTGYLATITSAAEQAFLNTINPTQQNLWLGATDVAEEGVWRWVGGPEAGQTLASTYSNWAPGEPNDYGSNGEDHLQGWWNGDRWNDLYNGWTHLNQGYLVEYADAPAAVPLPAGIVLLGSALGAFGLRRRIKTKQS